MFVAFSNRSIATVPGLDSHGYLTTISDNARTASGSDVTLDPATPFAMEWYMKSGTSLRTIHANRGITPRHFSRFVEHFVGALEDHDVPGPTILAVTQHLGLYVDDVVGGGGEAG